MLRSLTSFVASFVTLGGGILATIVLVRTLHAPLLVFPAVALLMVATVVVWWVTAPPASTEEKLRRLSRELGSGSF